MPGHLLTVFYYRAGGETLTNQERDSVVIVARSGFTRAATGKALVLLVALGSIAIAFLCWLIAVGSATTMPQFILVVAISAAGALAIFVLFVGQVLVIAQNAAAMLAGFELLGANLARPRWTVYSLARHPEARSGQEYPYPGLRFASDVIGGVVPFGELIVACAIDQRTARVYGRYGFAAIAPTSLAMIRYR